MEWSPKKTRQKHADYVRAKPDVATPQPKFNSAKAEDFLRVAQKMTHQSCQTGVRSAGSGGSDPRSAPDS
ncbi:MAG: hypothetical protein ACKO5Z_08185, partial [Burkholderiaceae bacterium]